MRWERVEPVEPCDSPDGHRPVSIVVGGTTVPVAILCNNCIHSYTVVVFEDDDPEGQT